MAIDTLIPPVRPSPGTKIKPTVKTLTADFGDGYTQEMPDGLNHIRDSVDLTWDTLLPEQAKQLETFMRAHKGTVPFWFDVDEGEMRKWTCKVWERARGEVYTFSATLTESFSLEI